MGIEYNVVLKQPSREFIGKALYECPSFHDFDKANGLYNFRWDGSEHLAMPNVSVQIQQDGLYICFYGGEKQRFQAFVEYIRELVVDKLGQTFDMSEI